MFDCGGMAFSETNLKPFVRICSSRLVNRTVPSSLAGPVPLLVDGRQTGSYGLEIAWGRPTSWPIPA